MTRGRRRNPRLLAWLALAFASTGLYTLVLSIAPRVGFPWPLEWMEGGTLAHALRLLHGQALYAAPSSEFIPYLYPPLAYLPMAIAVALFGPSLPAARLASLVCSALALGLLARAGARASRNALGGALAAGLFAMGFGYGGAFLDLLRVDACFIMLLAAAAERLLARKYGAALALLALSSFAKQHGLLLFAAVAGALVLEDRARHARSVFVLSAALLLAYLGFDFASNGWFGRYTIALPLSHSLSRRGLFSYAFVDVLLSLPVLACASALGLARRLRRLRAFDALLGAALLVSALGRAHSGGFDNVLLPGFSLLCVAASAPLSRALLGRDLRLGLVALAALGLQLALLWQPPRRHRPPAQSAHTFKTLLATLDHCAHGGSAVALDYASLTATPFVHTMALSDLRLGHGRELSLLGTRALLTRLRSASAPAALAVGPSFPELDALLDARYERCASLPAPPVAAGYTPGRVEAGELVLLVFARRAAAHAHNAQASTRGDGNARSVSVSAGF